MPSNLSYLWSFCLWCQLRLDRQVGWAWAVCHKLDAATRCQVKTVTSGRTRFWHLYQPSGDIHPYRMHTSCPRLSRLPFLWFSRHRNTFSSLEQKSQTKNICLFLSASNLEHFNMPCANMDYCLTIKIINLIYFILPFPVFALGSFCLVCSHSGSLALLPVFIRPVCQNMQIASGIMHGFMQWCIAEWWEWKHCCSFLMSIIWNNGS